MRRNLNTLTSFGATTLSNIIYEEQGNHPRLLKNGTDEPIYDSYFGNRWTWVPFEVGWSILHRSPIKVLASYTVAQDCPADPDMGWGCPPPVTETKEITVNAVNAVVKILEPEPPFLIWDPEDPSKNRLTVTFSITTAQNWYAEVELRVYRLDRASNEKPIRVIREIKGVPGTHPISWDGMIEGEMGLEPAERGIYAFDLWVNLPQTPKPLGDSDTRCSPFMTILRWKDEKGGEVHEAEYYGYDDKGTEEESDDEHIFLVRYGLRCGSAMLDDDGDFGMRAFVDEDSDGRLDEDWMDGIDNDNDGRIDEDPPGYCDEDWKDGLDNDKDGLVDEDPPNPVDASSGYILVYDPDLEPLRDEQGKIRRIDIRSLPCVVHEETDGLRASLDGVYHGVLVRVPASFMQKAGSYHFVIQVWDNHAHLHKDHQVKPALELNIKFLMPNIVSLVWEATDPQNQKWSSDGGVDLELNEGNGDPNTAIGRKLFPDWRNYQNLPPDEIRGNNPLSLVRLRVKIDKLKKSVVYLKLFDPDDPSLDAPVDHTDTATERKGEDNFIDGTGLPIHGVFREDNDLNRRKGRVVKIMDNGRIAAVETEDGEATVLVRVVRQPGNNFKVAGSCLREDLDKITLAPDGLRLQLESRTVPEGDEPIWRVRASELLTVWRRLFVEIDSMGAVDDSERLRHEDDLLTGDVPDPDPAGLGDAFRQCYIRVIIASNYNQTDLPWRHHFDSQDREATYAQQYRNSLPEAGDLWFVYIAGMYDPPEEQYPADDNDPEVDANGYAALIGRTQPEEPEYSFCYMEALRDVAKEWGWYENENEWMTDKVHHVIRVVTLHEIAHHFGVKHNLNLDDKGNPISVMWAPRTNEEETKFVKVPLKFAPEEIRDIRKIPRVTGRP